MDRGFFFRAPGDHHFVGLRGTAAAKIRGRQATKMWGFQWSATIADPKFSNLSVEIVIEFVGLRHMIDDYCDYSDGTFEWGITTVFMFLTKREVGVRMRTRERQPRSAPIS